MFGMWPVEHHVFLRKFRFLLRFRNSDNLICSLFVDNRSLKVIEIGAIQKLRYGFLFRFYSNYGDILYRLRDIATYW